MSDGAEGLAARLLAARRHRQPIARLPEVAVPKSAEAAYRVQDEVTRALGRIAGWKVGAPSDSAEPNCAPLLADRVRSSPARFAATEFRLLGVEAELAFRLGIDLPARSTDYGEDEVWAAIETMHVAIELVDSRYADFPNTDKLALLADHQSNGAFCYGAAIGDWRATDFLRQEARLLIDGKEVARARGGNVAGHPRRLLGWLANHCARRGRALAAGDIVTTGSHTGLHRARAGAKVTALFPELGEARLTIDP